MVVSLDEFIADRDFVGLFGVVRIAIATLLKNHLYIERQRYLLLQFFYHCSHRLMGN